MVCVYVLVCVCGVCVCVLVCGVCVCRYVLVCVCVSVLCVCVCGYVLVCVCVCVCVSFQKFYTLYFFSLKMNLFSKYIYRPSM